MAGYISKGSFGIDLIFHSAKSFLLSIQESWGAILIGSTAFLVHHSYSYSFNFIGKKEFLQTDIAQQLRLPITRIGAIWAAVFMFASFFIPGFLAGAKSPLISFNVLLVFLIFFKTSIDIYAHTREHKAAFKVWLASEKLNLQNNV